MTGRAGIIVLATAALAAATDPAAAILDQARGTPAEIFADVTQAMIASHLSALALYGRLTVLENQPPSQPPNRLF